MFRDIYLKFELFIKNIIDRKFIDNDVSLIKLVNRFSFFLFIIIPIIIGMIIIIQYISINTEFNNLKKNMLDIIETSFSENLKTSMLTNDFLKVRHSLEEIRNLDIVDEVKLVNKSKRVIISDDLKNERGYLDYPELDRIFESTSNNESIRSENKLFLIFENEPSCQRCHLLDGKVLGSLVVTFGQIEGVNKKLVYLLIPIFLGIAMVVLTRTFFSVMVDRYINEPINTLMNVSKNITLGETIEFKEVRSPIEFRYIYNVLAKLSVDIDEYIGEIKKRNSENEQIKILAGIGEMAAKVAHEVRNPLNTMDGAIRYLRKMNNGNQEYSEYIDLIEENIYRINNVASELLDATKPAKPVLEKINVVQVIRKRIQEFTNNYQLNHIQINLESVNKIPVMFVDKHQIIQVIDNLLENAIHACENNERGIINVQVKKINPTPMQIFVLLRMSDNGCGISSEELEKIFVPFYTTKSRGTGLGLSIVENIIKNHRGEMSVLSKIDKGTFVRIKIPIRT